MLVRGEVRAVGERETLATPVVAEVRFQRIGRQIYGGGRVVQVAQHGVPHPYEPTFDAEVFGP